MSVNTLRKIIVLLSAVTMGLFAFNSFAQTSTTPTSTADTTVTTKPVLQIQHWQTNNGAKVFFVARPEVKMVEINVVFAAGSSRDGDKPGVAQFTNAMLNQGTTKLSADQIATAFDNVGAQFSSTATRDMALVNLQSLTDPKYLDPALQTFAAIIAESNFPLAAFQRTQQQILNTIAQQQQTPDTVAKNAFYAAVYGSQPYGHPTLGTDASVRALTATDLINFYKKYYVAKNAVITLVGALTRQQAETIANQIVANLPSGEAATPLTPVAKLTAGKEEPISFPSAQMNIFIGQVGISYQNPNYFPLFVGNYILGGSSMTSRLFSQVREERGLAYSVASVFMPMSANGPFAVILQTRNDAAQQALQVVRDQLNQFITQGPSADELAEAKKKIINGFPLSIASNDNISDNLVNIGFYQLPLNYLDTYRQKIAAVSLEQLKTAFQQDVHPDKMITVMVGKTGATTKPAVTKK